MSKFQKKGKAGMPELNTSSLPDLIFSMLFFFMMVTSMREEELKVEYKVPGGTELEKLERKSLASYINIGRPTKDLRAIMGTASRIQLNVPKLQMPNFWQKLFVMEVYRWPRLHSEQKEPTGQFAL